MTDGLITNSGGCGGSGIHINEIAGRLGLRTEEIEPHGHTKAKICCSAMRRLDGQTDGKLVLVSAITPTPAGEGKTTTTISLGDGLRKIGVKAAICLREPSMGPFFGVKGGATGGGLSRIIPEDDINMHFTGDMHAVTSAHNLLAALIANHSMRDNALDLDVRAPAFRRVMDLNDRSLRTVVTGLGGEMNGVVRETGFDITAASEVMAILCLAVDVEDLKRRLGNILIGVNRSGKLVFARDLKAAGALAMILKDALKPNLVQTLYGTPALVHGGPFANIAHGCNSLAATRLALKAADVVVTEAGFATDLGAEKFFDIKCRIGNLTPAAAVVVATARALKMHGGVKLKQVAEPNLDALAAGFENLEKHLENIALFGVPALVAVNRFATDAPEELEYIVSRVEQLGVRAVVADGFEAGPEGSVELAGELMKLLDGEFIASSPVANAAGGKSKLNCLYSLDETLQNKIRIIAQKCYGADDAVFLRTARSKFKLFEKSGFGKVPVCVAKTQSSLSDDPKLLGRPRNFNIIVRDAHLKSGAGFVVALAGEIMTMPGLPKVPASEQFEL